jgi:hypothetical protein
MTILAPEFIAALFTRCERTGISVARTLLLARTLLRVETLGLLGHRLQNTTAMSICNDERKKGPVSENPAG